MEGALRSSQQGHFSGSTLCICRPAVGSWLAPAPNLIITMISSSPFPLSPPLSLFSCPLFSSSVFFFSLFSPPLPLLSLFLVLLTLFSSLPLHLPPLFLCSSFLPLFLCSFADPPPPPSPPPHHHPFQTCTLDSPPFSLSLQGTCSACSTGSLSSTTACSTTLAGAARKPCSRWSSWTARWAARASASARSAPEASARPRGAGRQATDGRTDGWTDAGKQEGGVEGREREEEERGE